LLVRDRVGCSTERSDAVRVQCLAAAVHKRVVGGGVRVTSLSGRIGALVSAGIAVAVRVGHTAGECGRSLAARAGSRVAPAPVAARVFRHLGLHADCRQCRVVVGVVAILLDLFPALVLVVLLLLASPPEQDGAENEERHDDDGDDDGHSSLAPCAESARVLCSGALEPSSVGAGRAATGCRGAALGGLCWLGARCDDGRDNHDLGRLSGLCWRRGDGDGRCLHLGYRRRRGRRGHGLGGV
jgi:hypothetical protein